MTFVATSNTGSTSSSTMSEEFTIEYDPDWLMYQILVLVALVSAASHTAGRTFDSLAWSVGVSAVLTTALLCGWLWKSLRPRVMEDV